MHQVITTKLLTAEIDMTDTVAPNDVVTFEINSACAICSTHHMLLKASPGAANVGRDKLFDSPYIADWNKMPDRS